MLQVAICLSEIEIVRSYVFLNVELHLGIVFDVSEAIGLQSVDVENGLICRMLKSSQLISDRLGCYHR